MQQVFTIDISSPIETVFHLIADLNNYGRWLPSSRLYHHTTPATTEATRLGTIYTDNGSVRMQGSVIYYEPHSAISFQQQLRRPIGGLTITAEYLLTSLTTGTHVERKITIKSAGIFQWLQPLLWSRIIQENSRILRQMKYYLEQTSSSSPQV